jgi:hypothetical protein
VRGLLRSVCGFVYGDYRLFGVFIHGWDLAVTSDQDGA